MSTKTTKNFFSCNWNNLLFYFGIFKGLDLFGNWLRVLLCICLQRLCKVYAQLFRFFLWKSAFTSNSIWCFFILPVPVLVLYCCILRIKYENYLHYKAGLRLKQSGYFNFKTQIKSLLYSWYYAESCNEWRSPSPRLSAWATQLQKIVAAVASRKRHWADLIGSVQELRFRKTVEIKSCLHILVLYWPKNVIEGFMMQISA